MWTAILTVQAGAYLQRMIEAIWPSFINFPNHLPENAGITSAGILCFMLYWVLQTSKSKIFSSLSKQVVLVQSPFTPQRLPINPDSNRFPFE